MSVSIPSSKTATKPKKIKKSMEGLSSQELQDDDFDSKEHQVISLRDAFSSIVLTVVTGLLRLHARRPR